MNKEKIEEYKNKLVKEKSAIKSEISKDEIPPSFGTDLGDVDEKTDEADAFSSQLVQASNLKERLSEIDIALDKIQTGKYGFCEKCGEEIEEEILNIDPESRFCKNDKLSL